MTDLRAAAREVADSSRIANEDRPPTPRTRRWRMVLAAALLAALAAIAGEHTWRGTDSPAPARTPAGNGQRSDAGNRREHDRFPRTILGGGCGRAAGASRRYVDTRQRPEGCERTA